MFLFVAFVCVCASICVDFFGDTPNGVMRGSRMALRLFVVVVLVSILVATKEPKFVDWIQVKHKNHTSI